MNIHAIAKLFISLMAIVFIAMGCRNCVKHTQKMQKVSNCHIYNGQEQNCIMAFEHGTTKCHFDKMTRTCMPTRGVEIFNCGAIELKDACNAQLSCHWNNQFAMCESKPMP